MEINQIVQTSLKLGNSKAGIRMMIKEIQIDLWGGEAIISGVRVLKNGQLSHQVECSEKQIITTEL